MPDDAPPRRFDQVAFGILREAVRQVESSVPEAEGVAFVVLWRFPDQDNIPSCQVVGTRGPLSTPDQLARLGVATVRFQHWIAEEYGASLVALRTAEIELMRRVHEHKEALARLGEAIERAEEPAQDVPLPHAEDPAADEP